MRVVHESERLAAGLFAAPALIPMYCRSMIIAADLTDIGWAWAPSGTMVRTLFPFVGHPAGGWRSQGWRGFGNASFGMTISQAK
jgi:hypothetical protein